MKPAGDGGWGMGYGISKGAFQRIAGFIDVELGPQGIRCFNLSRLSCICDPYYQVLVLRNARPTLYRSFGILLKICDGTFGKNFMEWWPLIWRVRKCRKALISWKCDWESYKLYVLRFTLYVIRFTFTISVGRSSKFYVFQIRKRIDRFFLPQLFYRVHH